MDETRPSFENPNPQLNGGFNLVGENLDDQTLSDVNKVLKKTQEEGLDLLPGEIEKPEEVSKAIGTINAWIKEELDGFGMSFNEIPSERIHLLPDAEYSKVLQEKNAIVINEIPSFFDGPKNCSYHRYSWYFNRGSFDIAKFCPDLVHEMLHIASFKKRFIVKEERRTDVWATRVGYRTRRPNGQERLVGFDEAVTTYLRNHLFWKHRHETRPAFGINWEEIKFYLGTDKLERTYDRIIDSIIMKMGEEEASRKIREGYFTGNMFFLKNIERFFGRGTLEVLNILRSGKTPQQVLSSAQEVLRFFTTDDQDEREEIRQKFK